MPVVLVCDPITEEGLDLLLDRAEVVLATDWDRERLLAMDRGHFAAIMKKWAGWLTSPRNYLANLSDEELTGIDAPAIVSYDFGDWHPKHTARELYEKLPNAESLEPPTSSWRGS